MANGAVPAAEMNWITVHNASSTHPSWIGGLAITTGGVPAPEMTRNSSDNAVPVQKGHTKSRNG
jgi:hypothetical protein